MEIGRRIYYDTSSKEVIQDVFERSGDVVETTPEEDAETFESLFGIDLKQIGILQLNYGDYAEEFASGMRYQVDDSGEVPVLVFYEDEEAEVKPDGGGN